MEADTNNWIKVKLLHSTPLWVCAQAIRDCYNSHHLSDTTGEMIKGFFIDDSRVEYNKDDYNTIPNGLDDLIISKTKECGERDRALIHNIGVQKRHASTLEHLVYTFDIDGISRACLQELARHRIASYSVKSTRYTLRELKKEEGFSTAALGSEDYKRASKYVVFTDKAEVNQSIIRALDQLRYLTTTIIKNDKIKYALPDAYKTSLTWTINARSLQNFLSLRTHHKALWEIQNLAKAIFEAIPDEHKYLFEKFNGSKENG